jgi:hypothetical protein
MAGPYQAVSDRAEGKISEPCVGDERTLAAGIFPHWATGMMCEGCKLHRREQSEGGGGSRRVKANTFGIKSILNEGQNQLQGRTSRL